MFVSVVGVVIGAIKGWKVLMVCSLLSFTFALYFNPIFTPTTKPAVSANAEQTTNTVGNHSFIRLNQDIYIKDDVISVLNARANFEKEHPDLEVIQWETAQYNWRVLGIWIYHRPRKPEAKHPAGK